MKKLEMKEMLKQNIEARQLVKINRARIDDNPIDCIPLLMDQNLLLIQYINDFQIDGFKIIRFTDITKVRYDDIEKFGEDILKKEGIYNQIKEPPLSSLSSWEVVFQELINIGKNIIVQCEKLEGRNFYIGKIIEVESKFIFFRGFDAVGEWDSQTSKIIFKNITSISLNDNYTNTISKYLIKND